MTAADWSDCSAWQQAVQLGETLVSEGHCRALSFQGFATTATPIVSLGHQNAAQPVNAQTLFLVASLTKPVIATAALLLCQRGAFGLNDRVCDHLPEWNRNERRRLTIRHLLSHTSGLPDQLPNNLEMRGRSANLSEFYEHVIDVPLEFAPGTRAQYQSMGFVVLARLLEHITGESLPILVQQLIFTPLEMHNSYLGLSTQPHPEQLLARVAEVELTPEQQQQAGNWNSSYWQTLGAPWGGMLSTPGDMLKFCTQPFSPRTEVRQLFTPQLWQEACQNQLPSFEGMNERDQQHRAWGLGWRHNWKTHRETFGDFLPAEVVGHWGATGALMWIDRPTARAAVICCSRPTDRSSAHLIRLSNAISTALDRTA